jgi:hypothetical protein
MKADNTRFYFRRNTIEYGISFRFTTQKSNEFSGYSANELVYNQKVLILLLFSHQLKRQTRKRLRDQEKVLIRQQF